MSDRTDQLPRDSGAPGVIWVFAAFTAVFLALGGWFLVGALQSSEPRSYLVVAPVTQDEAVVPMTEPLTGWVDAPPAPTPGGSTPPPTSTPRPANAVPPRSTAAGVGASAGNAARVDAAWAARTSAATGIPLRALRGYAGAELAMTAEAPGCGIRWNTLAALGAIESAHGTHAGSSIGDDGVTRPGIFGIDLTGVSSARIADTDGGLWDGKADIDRAVGPLQFIPATWEAWGADGNGDGIRDPQQIDDAALAAARYLCHHGDLTSPERWRTAIFAYNHLDTYVNAVARAANEFAQRATR